jgi:RNA polymerase sigma-70 factor, ECF subfamily
MPGERFDSLLEEAKRGGEQAWSEIYRRLAPPLLGYLRANGAIEPEDTMSEVLLQVARDLSSFEGGERSFRAWVFPIAHHRLIDARRHSVRRPVEPVAVIPEPEPVEVDDAAEQALARIGEDEVRRVLASLSPDQRAALLLRVIGGLTVAELARALDKSPGAIKALQRRGLEAIRRELDRGCVTL